MKTKQAKAKQAIYLDNNFFVVSAQLAKSLTVGKTLPKHGWERKADPETLKAVEFCKVESVLDVPDYTPSLRKMELSRIPEAWIKRTPLSWWQGKTVECGWVWAIHLCW